MADRNFTQFRYSMERAVVELFAYVSFGAAGAPTLTAAKSKGIASITRTGTGAYTVVFGLSTDTTKLDIYQRLLGASASFLNATAPASPAMYVVSDDSASATASVDVQFTDLAGSATDPGSGEVGLLKFTLSNSTAI